jgi:DNA repair protein RecN (Recombination protein N)
MLDELRVENLGIISTAHVEPGAGLVAVTGETGAGKTLLLGALRLLRGDAARSDRIGPDGDEARVEGRFLLDDGGEISVQRRVGAGRSRAYLDGSMVPARTLGERLSGRVSIVAQHEHVTLGREADLRAMIDAGLDDEGRVARNAYGAAWEHLEQVRADLAALGGDRRALEREADLAAHQAREIQAAGPEPDEEDHLRARAERLRHAEEIAGALAEAHGSLSGERGVTDLLGEAVEALRRSAAFDPDLDAAEQRAAALAAEAGDLAADLRRRADAVEQDPAEIEQTQQRLSVLGDLRRKYGETLPEVIEFGAAAARRAAEIPGLLERADTLARDAADAQAAAAVAGERLAEARRRSAKGLAQAAAAHLRELGFRDPVLDLEVAPGSMTRTGTDGITMEFASDRELTPGPVSRVASGGELSRLVLAVRLAAGVGEAPVVAFDEIDAGIGGATALAMGEKLAALAAGRQVLVVTHLPQVAAFAHTHLVVDRDGARAGVRRVDGDDRVAELTRMLGGLPASERGREHAEELLALAAAGRVAR